MKVILKNDLFTPFGRFKKTEYAKFPDELPDEVRPHLPKTAVIVEDAKDPLPVPKRLPVGDDSEEDDVPKRLPVGDDSEEDDVPEPVTMTEMHKASKGVSALEHFSKKK